jgi:hypothetical protein
MPGVANEGNAICSVGGGRCRIFFRLGLKFFCQWSKSRTSAFFAWHEMPLAYRRK